MSRIIMLILTGTSVGLTSVGLGVIRAIERKGVRLSVFESIAQPCIGGDTSDQIMTIVCADSSTTTAAEPLKMSYVEGLLSSSQRDVLMEEIIANYHANTKDAEVALAEGLVPTRKHQFAQSLSYEITKTLNTKIIFVMFQGTGTPEQSKERIELTRNSLGGAKNTSVADIIANRLNVPVDERDRTRPDLSEIFDDSTKAKVNNVDPVKLQESSLLPILDAVPQSFDLIVTRTINMARHLSAIIIDEGNINTHRVKSVTFCACSISHMPEHFRADPPLMISADYPDAPVAACLAATNGVKVGALLLISGYEMDARISELRERAFTTGLPVLMMNTDVWQTSFSLQSFNLEALVDDYERIEKVQEYVANHINADWTDSLAAASERSHHLSSPAFRYRLIELIHKAGRRIVLPEGDEPRTVKAAAICARRGTIAYVLLSSPAEISRVAASQGVGLGAGIEIVDPEVIREGYVGRPVRLRKNKGMTETVAREQPEGNMVLGMLMLEQDKANGPVSGAVHTTVDATRPPLQLIKIAPGSSLVSPMFFALLPGQVYVYGDCAINPDLTTGQLAGIMIQSADSAAAFGIEPHVAMPSYSTDISGTGSDVGKVREATRLAQERHPDLMIDGPLRYDAAVMANVVKSETPNSPVAGHAIVFIFPDLNTGNTIHKVIQRSADLISIGPVPQGMRKLVNNLSRSALVDDIIYTIALTTTQSTQQQ